jgi:molecular chaperone GrpE
MNKKDSNGKLPEEESNQRLDENIEKEKIEEDSVEDNELIEDSSEDLEEKVLRAQAEVQNVRKTAQKEILKARLYGSESLVKDLLPSIDNLFRTLEFQNVESKSVPSEGIELVIRDMLNALEKNGISIVDPQDEEFNPDEHEAISVVENNDVSTNTCIQVTQKGYKFKDRVIRPAMVIVSKK